MQCSDIEGYLFYGIVTGCGGWLKKYEIFYVFVEKKTCEHSENRAIGKI
ncbi:MULTISPECIES: hypothetical protein [unclassified Desulfovibrio]